MSTALIVISGVEVDDFFEDTGDWGCPCHVVAPLSIVPLPLLPEYYRSWAVYIDQLSWRDLSDLVFHSHKEWSGRLSRN